MPKVFIASVLGVNSEYGVCCYSSADCRVECSSEFVSARDDAEKCGHNAESGADTFAVAGGVLSLDHEDDADEEESANDFVNNDSEVHLEVLASLTVVGCASLRVSWGEGSNILSPDIEGAHPCESHGSESTTELGKHDKNAEQKVLAIIAKRGENTECDCRVKVASRDVAKYDD